MSNNNNKNKPASTITKLIDYFNDDEEEEEEEEEVYQSNNNNNSSFGASGKISHLYSYRDENAIEEDQDENNEIDNINNENNNIINNESNENQIFTTLYPNEQPDSSFCCEEHPKGDNKFNNKTEFIGRAVSFHRKKGETNENNNLINDEEKNKISYGFGEDNKEISKISKENTFTNNYIDNLVSFSKDKINMTNNENNAEQNNNNDINNTNLNDNLDNDNVIKEIKNDSKIINININNNDTNDKEINSININKNNDINNNSLNNKENISEPNNNIIKIEENNNNNEKNDSLNINKNSNSNSNVSNYNIIYNNEKIENNKNIGNDSMINITKNNGYLMDYDEKTLEEEENAFLELEKQRKEKEKIKKKKEELLEQLRIKQEEKKALEKKLEEKKQKDLNNKNTKINEDSNDNNKDTQIQIKIEEKNINNNINDFNPIIDKNEDEKVNENENDNKQIIYCVNNSLNNNINSNNEEINKENELINSNNYQKFDSFKNINNFINNNGKNKSTNNKIENNPKSNIYETLDKKLFDPEYLIDSNTFDAIENNKKNLNQHNIKKNSIMNINKIEESKKETNEKENKNIKILKNMINLNLNTEKELKPKKNMDKKEKYLNEYNTYKNPIELTLYNDALKRRKKLENIDKTVMKGIKLNSNKTKITNASYKVAIEHDEKIIEKIINRYSILNKKNNTKYINIIGMALSLRDMKIFRELYKKDKYNLNNAKNIYPLLTLKKIILSIDKRETRKIKEINFLQQTWLLLNKDENKEYINKDIFLGLLKIIFSPEGTIKEIEDLLNKYLEAVLVGINLFNSKKINNNIININSNKKDVATKDILISPIDNKKISYNNLWPLSKYLKTFLELKKNLIAYKTTDNMKNLKKEKYRDMISRHQKINSNIVNSNYILDNPQKNIDANLILSPISKKKLKNEKVDSNFDKLYQKFLEKEQCRKIVLEEMRKKKEMDELKELKEKPTISKFRANTISEKDFSLLGKKKEDIHDRLYKMDKDIKAKKKELIEEKEKLLQEKIKKEQKMNKLKINSRLSKLRMNKSFDHPQKCKGFDEFVRRNRNGYIERLRVKYLLENTPRGENYEEIMRRNITPPNITDIRRMKEKEMKNKKNNDNNNGLNSDENESDENAEYFNLQIKLPNGKMQTLKVYENDDANEVVEEFCKIHSIDDSIKNKLVANIETCQRQFLSNGNKSNDNQNEEYLKNNEEDDEEHNNILVDDN